MCRNQLLTFEINLHVEVGIRGLTTILFMVQNGVSITFLIYTFLNLKKHKTLRFKVTEGQSVIFKNANLYMI